MIDPPAPNAVRAPSLERLEAEFRSLGTALKLTRGHYELDGETSVADLDWNHMDQGHRPYIHDTYHRAARLAAGRDFAVSLSRIGRLPVLVQVADVRLGPGQFYQSFDLLGLWAVHSTIRMDPSARGARQRIDWLIVSHRAFGFLHGWLNRRMYRLNRVQNDEDIPIRRRRTELRRTGWRFRTDDPDFLSANTDTDNALPPPVVEPVRLALPPPSDVRALIAEGGFTFVVRRTADHVLIWPGVCPHEGGPLTEGTAQGDQLVCPWHGFAFRPLRLDHATQEGKLHGFRLRLDGDALLVSTVAA